MMEFEYTDEEGVIAVKLARKAIEEYIDIKLVVKNSYGGKFVEKRGVFTTINRTNGELRGCIGFPEPVYPLGEAIIKSAIAAATEDPRFQPVTKSELNDIVIEVSLLTKPVPLLVEDRKKMPENIKIGVHGLIASSSLFSGLLLPQVAVEEKMNAAEFLDAVCWKAGMEKGCWLDKDVQIKTFTAEIFYEVEPNGPIFRKMLETG